MKAPRFALLLAALSLVACREGASANQSTPGALAGPDLPALTGRVVDGANLLTPQQESALSGRLADVEREVGPQFAIVTVPSLGGETVEAYSLKLARRWGLGSKERDDGLMLLVAPNERKVRIEVGYGLERRVTDPFAAKVIKEHILPRFEKGDFAAGIAEGSNALIERLRSKASDSEIAKADRVVEQ